jgi:putative endonuclease
VFYVYLLECKDKTYYVGCTNNLEKRVIEHNSLKNGAHYTKIRRPVILKYSEEFKTLLEARGREAEIKSWERKRKEALVSGTIDQKLSQD